MTTFDERAVKRLERFEKLPAWAQAEIRRLEQDASHWKGLYQREHAGETRIIIGLDYPEMRRGYVDESAGLTFRMSEQTDDRMYVKFDSRGGLLLNTPYNQLIVLPEAANSLRVMPVKS